MPYYNLPQISVNKWEWKFSYHIQNVNTLTYTSNEVSKYSVVSFTPSLPFIQDGRRHLQRYVGVDSHRGDQSLVQFFLVFLTSNFPNLWPWYSTHVCVWGPPRQLGYHAWFFYVMFSIMAQLAFSLSSMVMGPSIWRSTKCMVTLVDHCSR